MEALADEQEVGSLYRRLRDGWSGPKSGSSHKLYKASFGSKSLGFQVKIEERIAAVLVVEVGQSEKNIGLKFRLNGTRLMAVFGLDESQLCSYLPNSREEMPNGEWNGATSEEIANWYGFKGYFRTTDEIDKFLGLLKGPQA